MTSGQKIAFSLLAAFALFGAFVLSFHTFLFKEIEMKFYTEAKIEENVEQLNNISESYDSYIKKVLEKIETGQDSYVNNGAVRSFYAQNPSEKDISERRKLTEQLFDEIPALDGIRLIDKNGRNVHFSTYDKKDILRQSGVSKIYKNYGDIVLEEDEIPYSVLSKNINEEKSTILFDSKNSRVIIAVPFFWMDGIYSASCYFYFNLRDIEKELIKNDVINIGQKFQIFSDDDLDGGFVLGVPSSLTEEFKSPIINYFDFKLNDLLGTQTPEKLLEKEDGIFYVALSSTLKNDNKIVGVYTSDLFEISTELKVLIYICVFISLFLILFLVFSLRRDPVVVLKNRIKRIQYGVIKEYIDNKEKVEWGNVVDQLQFRKKDLSAEILKSLKVRSKKHQKELDEFLDKNWEEIFAVMGAQSSNKTGATANSAASVNVSADSQLLKEIRNVLSEVLREVQSEVRSVKGVAKVAPVVSTSNSTEENIDQVEEIEELDENIEDIEEIEELVDDAEEVEDIEEIDEVEDAEELEEVEEIEELDENVDDVEEIEEIEEIADDVEEIESAEDVEEAEEIESIEEADDIEEIEELDEDVEEIEDAEEIEEADEVDDVEEIEELEEDLDDVEELEEADPDAELGHIETNPINGVWDEDFFKNFCGAFNYEYKKSNDTFFATERFPTVDDLFAEELVLGSFELGPSEFENTLDIKAYPLQMYEKLDEASNIDEPEEDILEISETSEEEPEIENNIEEVEEIEELPESSETDEMFINKDLNPSHYSMTTFGDDIMIDTPELEEVLQEEPIVEKDGVYSISDNLDYTDVIQDEEFKTLVDSIIEN